MKRNPETPRTSAEPPGMSGTPQARPWVPRGFPRDPQGTPGNSHRRQKNSYVSKCTAPEPLGCCTRILALQGIIPKTPLDRFMMYTSRTDHGVVGHRAQGFRSELTPMGERSRPIVPQNQAPLHILRNYLFIFIYEIASLIY